MVLAQKTTRIKYLLLNTIFSLFTIAGVAQVSAVEFGKNRLQFKKFNWQYYQTKNFNGYFSQNGQELAKYIIQIAEKELPEIEDFVEYSLQRRANVIIYNSFSDLQQSNIGQGMDWQNTGGVTKLVNNKMIVYFTADHADLRRQIRQGIAKVLTENLLFGDDLGEFAGNQTLLDLPQWLTDGYISYVAENWSTSLDDDLKSEILSGKYRKFYHLAFAKPVLAGHSFWYYIEEKYKRENVTYLLYLARVYKNLNRACLQVAKKKFKDVLADFMVYQDEKYNKDIQRRKNYPKGSEVTSELISEKVDYFRFNVNPNRRDNSYAVVQYKRGQYRVLHHDGDKYRTLIKVGAKSNVNEIDPNMPLMAWDQKGTRLSVIFNEKGKIKLNIYDMITKLSPLQRDLTEHFQLVQDVKYSFDNRTLLMSAVKNGYTDIFTYDIENEKVRQITNDVYDDLDASFVAFPAKTGIIFASNRPGPRAKSADTVLPGQQYNVFMITDYGDKPELNQITQLTKQKFGSVRFPTQYNQNHFTFVTDENGVANRYAGFFDARNLGTDTLVLIGDDILRNPAAREVDSALRAQKKSDVDSIAIVAVSNDTAYTFPLTNYASNLRESRIAGENNQVSEVTRQSDDKILYKLKIDENVLRRRNVTAVPTAYIRRLRQLEKQATGQAVEDQTDTSAANNDVFQNEFGNEKRDTSRAGRFVSENDASLNTTLARAKLYPYKPPKYSTDYIVSGFNNSVLVNRYQPYAGGAGPVTLSTSTPLNGIIRIGTSELMEDLKFSGGYRLSTNLKDNDWLFQFQNLRRMVDWGFTYYRNVQEASYDVGSGIVLPGKQFSNLYQANLSYPLDRTKSIRVNFGLRRDRAILKTIDLITADVDDIKTNYAISHIEYVYDNTLNPAQNIWDGLRYKIFFDYNMQLGKATTTGRDTYVAGFDGRYYYPIYRNFIYAVRAAADFSLGSQKMIYYLGGVDNWLQFGSNTKQDETGATTYRYFNPNNVPDPDNNYAFQTLAVNMRGFIQNVANGNNAFVINSEFRFPVFTTLFNKPINNAFLRNFQLTQFIDLGTAWNGKYDEITRPSTTYTGGSNNPASVVIKNGGIGPFVGGYGFGARSTLLGYFLKLDAGWQMNGFFKGKPILYVSLGLDF
jgi:hypothetical protein